MSPPFENVMFPSQHVSPGGWVKWLAEWCKEDVNVPQTFFWAVVVNLSNLALGYNFSDLTSDIAFQTAFQALGPGKE